MNHRFLSFISKQKTSMAGFRKSVILISVSKTLQYIKKLGRLLILIWDCITQITVDNNACV